MEEGITEIPDYTFSGCWNLTTMYLPQSLTQVTADSFWGLELGEIHWTGVCDSYIDRWLETQLGTEGVTHDWKEATYDAPKTCVNCQLTEGTRWIVRLYPAI